MLYFIHWSPSKFGVSPGIQARVTRPFSSWEGVVWVWDYNNHSPNWWLQTHTCAAKPRFHHQCIDECMERTSLRPYLVVSAPSTGVSNVHEAKNVPLQVRMHAWNGFCQWGTTPPSVYPGRHWCQSHDKTYQAFPLDFCTLQVIVDWMVGRPGNKARVDQHVQCLGLTDKTFQVEGAKAEYTQGRGGSNTCIKRGLGAFSCEC